MRTPFRIVDEISRVETIAAGSGINELQRLVRRYGVGRWRKRKGVAFVQILDGPPRLAELHWYEATGIGRREVKIKRYLDP